MTLASTLGQAKGGAQHPVILLVDHDEGGKGVYQSALLGGKKFNFKTTPIDEVTEYGKAYFAEHVVKANATTIDLTSFDALLDRLRQVLAHDATLPK